MVNNNNNAITVDRLNINFKHSLQTDLSRVDINFLETQFKRHYKRDVIILKSNNVNNNYIYNYVLLYKNEEIATLDIVQRQSNNKDLHRINVYNSCQYQKQQLIDEFLKKFHENFDYKVVGLEIAIDSNINFYSKLNRLYKKDALRFVGNYDLYKYGKEEKKNEDLEYTYYMYKNIKNTKAFKKTDNIKMRAENKTIEIDESSNKYYIKDYLKQYLDTSKDIYRLELLIYNKAFVKSKDTRYYNQSGDYVTAYKKKNYPEKYKDYTTKNIVEKRIDFDISKTFNSSYLTDFFNENAKTVILNLEDVIKLDITNTNINIYSKREHEVIKKETNEKTKQRNLKALSHKKIEIPENDSYNNTCFNSLINTNPEFVKKLLDCYENRELLNRAEKENFTDIFKDLKRA